MGALFEGFPQDLAGRVFGDGVDEDDAAVEALVSGQVVGHVVLDVGEVDFAAGDFDDVGAGGFGGVVFGVEDADDGGVEDVRVQHEDGLEFGGGDLPASDLDHLLLQQN